MAATAKRPKRVKGVVQDIIPQASYGFIFIADGTKVFMHRDNFRAPALAAFNRAQHAEHVNSIRVHKGLVVDFIMAPAPPKKKHPEAKDIVIVRAKAPDVAAAA